MEKRMTISGLIPARPFKLADNVLRVTLNALGGLRSTDSQRLQTQLAQDPHLDAGGYAFSFCHLSDSPHSQPLPRLPHAIKM